MNRTNTWQYMFQLDYGYNCRCVLEMTVRQICICISFTNVDVIYNLLFTELALTRQTISFIHKILTIIRMTTS